MPESATKLAALEVAAALERIHEQTPRDEMMLVGMGESREIQSRTLKVMADCYSSPAL